MRRKKSSAQLGRDIVEVLAKPKHGGDAAAAKQPKADTPTVVAEPAATPLPEAGTPTVA